MLLINYYVNIVVKSSTTKSSFVGTTKLYIKNWGKLKKLAFKNIF